MIVRACVIAVCAMCALCALPPEYEGEIYCPAGYCKQLNRRNARNPITGSASRIYECCKTTDAHNTTRVTPWGPQARPNAEEFKNDLIATGYHLHECDAESECARALDECAQSTPMPLPLRAIATLRRVERFFFTLSGPNF
jgi:hypothetical protein